MNAGPKEPLNEKIERVFLANGFKVKPQQDGSIGLNPYVFTAVRALLAELISEQPVALHQHRNTVNGCWEECDPKLMDALAETHPLGSEGVRKLYQLPPADHDWEENKGFPYGYERK